MTLDEKAGLSAASSVASSQPGVVTPPPSPPPPLPHVYSTCCMSITVVFRGLRMTLDEKAGLSAASSVASSQPGVVTPPPSPPSSPPPCLQYMLYEYNCCVQRVEDDVG